MLGKVFVAKALQIATKLDADLYVLDEKINYKIKER